jgi:hypothetical protein
MLSGRLGYQAPKKEVIQLIQSVRHRRLLSLLLLRIRFITGFGGGCRCLQHRLGVSGLLARSVQIAKAAKLCDALLLLTSTHGFILLGLCRRRRRLGMLRRRRSRCFGRGWHVRVLTKSWEHLPTQFPELEQCLVAKLVNIQFQLSVSVLLKTY